MINNIECAVVEHNAAAYTEVESIVLMLCKECAAGVPKINLPESLEAAVNACETVEDEKHPLFANHHK